MAIAYAKPVADYISNADASTYTHGSSFTPTANSLQVIVVTATATTDVAVMTGGSGWATGGVNPGDGAPELICSATFNSGVSTLYVFAGTAGASPGSWTPVFDCTGDAATGCMMVFTEWTGHNLSDPIRQFKIKNSTTGANPTITADAAILTTSGGLMAVATATNPAGVTPDGATFEIADIGHTSPTTGLEVAEWESGNTATTLTATRASTNHGIVLVEIEIASGTTYTLTGNTGALTLTGNSGVLKASRKLNGNTGALTLTGNSGLLRVGRKLAGQTGALTLTGNTGTLRAARKLVGQTGALILTGNDGALTYTPAGPTYTLTGETGALILTAGNATLTKGSVADEYAGFYVYWPAPKKRRKFRKVKRRKLNVIEDIATEVSEAFNLAAADVTPFIRNVMQHEARAEELQRKALQAQEEARKAREEAVRIKAEEEAQARIKELIEEIGAMVKKQTIAKKKRLNMMIATALEWL